MNFISGSRFLGAYLFSREQIEAWVKPQKEAWSQWVRVVGKISRGHPHSAYSGLGMPLQLEWQYLKRTVPGVGTLMGLIKESLREKSFPVLFGGEVINADFRKILGHIVKHGGLGIPDPRLSVESS